MALQLKIIIICTRELECLHSCNHHCGREKSIILALPLRRKLQKIIENFNGICPTFFLLLLNLLNLNYMNGILQLVPVKIIILKSSYNWFKYWHSSAAPAAHCQLLVYIQPPHILCVYDIKPKLCAKHVLTVRESF